MADPKMKRRIHIIQGLVHSMISKVNPYFLSILIVGVISLICLPLANTMNYHVVSYILLFVVSILSSFLGIGPVLLASTLSALVWNFFFIPPHFTLHIERSEDLLIFGLFFIIAFVNAVLTTRLRYQEKLARDREKRTDALFRLTRELSKASGLDEVLAVAIDQIKTHFGVDPLFLLQDGNEVLSLSGRLQKDKKLTNEEYQAARRVFQNGQNTDKQQEQYNHLHYIFIPLKGNRINPGVLAIKPCTDLFNEQKSYWDTFLALVSTALEREFLGELAQKVRFLDESDRLYKTLFNSISHEFRIPVATIMGAADSILNSSNSKPVQLELCHEIFTASLRLNRLIENLLNISRLESGRLTVRLDWYDINDLFNKVVEDLHDELQAYRLQISLPDEMPLIRIDFGLMEQVIYNLLFNSIQYTPEGSLIELKAWYNDQNIVLEISDNGPGLPENEINDVFKKFFRGDRSVTGGLGLGLSIVKGFVEAHNGTISVENLIAGGALFTLTIPSEKADFQNM